jgi:Domain of unknown function (DUF4340)
MMTPRRIAVLLVAGVVLVALALWISSQRHLERTVEAGQRVLPDLKNSLNSVSELRLSKGDGTHTTLKKTATDWVVAERDFPSDSGQVRKLLLDLSDLEVIENKTREPASYPQIGVEDVNSPQATGTRLDVVEPGKTLSLIVGKTSGTKSTYVRVANTPQSFLASPQLTPDADPRRWLDKALIDIPEKRIKEIHIQPASGPAYTVTRANAQQTDFTVPDLPKGRELSSTAAANVTASGLAALSLDDVRKASTEGASPQATSLPPSHGRAADAKQSAAPATGPATAGTAAAQATFHTFDGLQIDLKGHQEGDQRFIALSAKASSKDREEEARTLNARLTGWEFEIPSYKYDSLFRPLEDMLKKLPEPAKPQAKSKAKAPAAAAPAPAAPK